MNIHNLQSGDRITGLYYGVHFSGDIFHPAPVLSIVLDKPITVYGSRRYTLKMFIRADGTTLSGQIWSTLDSHRNFYMADRFKVLENRPAYCVKLYREMKTAALDRREVARELRLPAELRNRETQIADACQTLISHYTKLL